MKLPNDSNLPKSPLTERAKGQSPTDSVVSSRPVTSPLSQNIKALVNTWAKVQSVQTLPAKQNQQVVAQLSALIKQPNLSEPKSHSISEKLNLDKVAQTLINSSLPKNTQLALVKILSVQGPISVLSAQPVKAGEQVRIVQSTNGQLSFAPQQAPIKGLEFRHQFLQGHNTVKATPLIDNHQIAKQILEPLSNQIKLPNVPATTLQTQTPLAADQVKTALQSAGQNFEAKVDQLLTLLKQAQQTGTPNNQSKPLDNMSSKVNQVESQIQKWVQDFQQKFTKESANSQPPQNSVNPKPQSSLAAPQVSSTNPKLEQLLASLPDSLTPKLKLDIQQAFQNVQQDQKSWMGQTQQSLIQVLSKQIAQNGSRFIPNWPKDSVHVPNLKTFTDLSNWLDLLIQPKVSGKAQELPYFKPNTSTQIQLNQTLTALINSFSNTQESQELNLLRQILNLSQNLIKTQHDQLLNRSWINQGDFQSIQMSLPYLHQNQMEWCELEFHQDQTESQAAEKAQNWHLILRFAQDTHESFSIESKMLQAALSITLWAENPNQLQHLNSGIPILKHKLNEAGFLVEYIHSKHGAPALLNKPIQQSLIDVHT